VDHPLDDCRLKIAGAKSDFDALYEKIIEFTKENSFVYRVKADLKTGEHRIEFPEPPALPREWGISVGKIVGLVHSALDYLIVALIREAGGKEDTNSSFPIFEDRDKYLAIWRKKPQPISFRDRYLRGVPDPLKGRIDDFQPYNRGGQAFRDPLALLLALHNADEHRALQAAYTSIDLPLHAVRFPTTTPISDVAITFKLPVDIDVEAKVTRKGKTFAPQFVVAQKVQMEPRTVELQIVFGADDPARMVTFSELGEIVRRVEEIVESFSSDLA